MVTQSCGDERPQFSAQFHAEREAKRVWSPSHVMMKGLNLVLNLVLPKQRVHGSEEMREKKRVCTTSRYALSASMVNLIIQQVITISCKHRELTPTQVAVALPYREFH